MSASHTLRAAVLGDPVSHSLSPHLHGYWLKRYGIDGRYTAWHVKPPELRSALARMVDEQMQGGNLTIPHKEAAMEWMQSLSETARRIGAINTVIVQPDGTLHGDNTDAYGFIENLKQQQPEALKCIKNAVILGAGGASRAAIAALQQQGVSQISIINRSEKRAQALAESMGNGCEPIAWDSAPAGFNAALACADLIVNTTSLGMKGSPPLVFPMEELAPDAIVYDIVYRPLMTGFLRQAQAGRHRIVTGLGMLIHQARPGFQAWFGAMPEYDSEIERALEASLAEHD